MSCELLSKVQSERIKRLKHVVRQLASFYNKIVDMIASESQVPDVEDCSVFPSPAKLPTV